MKTRGRDNPKTRPKRDKDKKGGGKTKGDKKKSGKKKGEPGKRRDEDRVWKVYVSGFHDWPASKKEAIGFDKWKCLQNPSGRLFIGKWHPGGTKPAADKGPLPRLLKRITMTKDGRMIEWTFDTLPVEWNVIQTVDLTQYDVVVNIGYGVYAPDPRTLILLEQGAYNGRGGQADAAAKTPGETGGPSEKIDPQAGTTLTAPTAVSERVDDTAGDVTIGGTTYEAAKKDARPSNDYICNDTHYNVLQQVKAASGRPRAGYFIHIPKPARVAGYNGLARALSNIIERLIQP